MRPALRYVVLAAVGLAVLYFGVSRIMDALRTDESRIRLVFREVGEYARARDAGAVLEYLDPEYHDPQGFAAPEVKRIVWAYLNSAESVEAEIEPLGIDGLEVEGDEADVLVRARIVIQMPDGEKLTLGDAKIRGEYMIVRLRRHETYFRVKSARQAQPGEVRAP